MGTWGVLEEVCENPNEHGTLLRIHRARNNLAFPISAGVRVGLRPFADFSSVMTLEAIGSKDVFRESLVRAPQQTSSRSPPESSKHYGVTGE